MMLSERLREEGVDLFVIARKMDLPGEAVFSQNVEVIRVRAPFPGTQILEEKSIKNLLISVFFSIGCLARLISRRKTYEVVHFHGASIPLILSLPFLKVMGKKVVAKVAAANLGTEAGSFSGNYSLLGGLLARMMKGVDAFVAISDEIREGLIRDGVLPERIHRISNFIDPEIFRPPAPGEKERIKETLGYARNTVVLFAGRLVERKGVACLLDAWPEASRDFPEARLLILGEGPLKEKLEGMATRLGIATTARFAGRVDNVAEHLRAADLFVLPSLQEGMSNSLLEAMASGVPIVATRIGGVTDVVEEGRTAVVVAPGEKAELSRGIRTVLAGPIHAQALASRALETIRDSFGLDSRVKRYMHLYANLNRQGPVA
jgi:glycosyltransferase involved in cell wall biosynthesis